MAPDSGTGIGMALKPMMYQCFCCESGFQFGPHTYNGKHVAAYEMTVCLSCYEGNWDGWGPAVEAKIIASLKSQGLPVPARNAAGWLPRDG